MTTSNRNFYWSEDDCSGDDVMASDVEEGEEEEEEDDDEEEEDLGKETGDGETTASEDQNSTNAAFGRAKISPSGATTRDKQNQINLTLQWLEENYCISDKVCLPRNVLYNHYLDFCFKQELMPACAATFGKTIRQKFPHLTTRRLGTRGHSKYHYYGIGIRETSPYYYTIYSGTGLTRFSGAKLVSEGGFTRKYSLSSRSGTILPEFPCTDYFLLPECLPGEMVDTFLVMYKTHSQCILDSTLAGAFTECIDEVKRSELAGLYGVRLCDHAEIENYMMHFWHGIPEHLYSLTEYDVVADIICICDSVVYQTLIDVLIPATMQEMPENLLCDIRTLAKSWENWLREALANISKSFSDKKLAAGRRFASALKRQASFLHLAQTARPVLYDAQLVNQMIADIDMIDLNGIDCHGFCSTIDVGDFDNCSDSQLAVAVLKEFREMLHKQATVEAFIEWLDVSVEQKIIKPNKQNGRSFEARAQDFVLRWSYLGGRISHSLTINNAKSFASIHLIHLLLTEYMLLAIESQLYIEKDRELQSAFGEHCEASSSPHQNSSFHRLPPVYAETTYLPMRFIPGPKYPLYYHHSHHPRQRHHELVDGVRRTLAEQSDRAASFDRGNGSNHLGQLNIMLKTVTGSNAVLTPPLSPVLLSQSVQRPTFSWTSCTSTSSSSHVYHCLGNSDSNQLAWSVYNQSNRFLGGSLRNSSATRPTISPDFFSKNQIAFPGCSYTNYPYAEPVSLEATTGRCDFATQYGKNNSRLHAHGMMGLTGSHPADYSSYPSGLTTDEMSSLNKRCAQSTSVDFDSPLGLFYRQPSRATLTQDCSVVPVDQSTGKASDRYLATEVIPETSTMNQWNSQALLAEGNFDSSPYHYSFMAHHQIPSFANAFMVPGLK